MAAAVAEVVGEAHVHGGQVVLVPAVTINRTTQLQNTSSLPWMPLKRQAAASAVAAAERRTVTQQNPANFGNSNGAALYV